MVPSRLIAWLAVVVVTFVTSGAGRAAHEAVAHHGPAAGVDAVVRPSGAGHDTSFDAVGDASDAAGLQADGVCPTCVALAGVTRTLAPTTAAPGRIGRAEVVVWRAPDVAARVTGDRPHRPQSARAPPAV